MFNLTFYDELGHAMPLDSVQWKSSNPAIASIISPGLAFGLQAGQSMIVGTYADQQDSALLTVISNLADIAEVNVVPASAQIQLGDSLQMSAVIYNGYGDVLSGQTVIWMSSDPSIASITSGGKVYSLQTGHANIKATVQTVSSLPVRIDVIDGLASRTGDFQGFTGISAAGTAILEQQEDQAVKLSFSSGFSITNGPDLDVYLSNIAGINQESVLIAPLKSNTGAQSYDLPASIALHSYNYVIIHCTSFNHLFGYAQFD